MSGTINLPTVTAAQWLGANTNNITITTLKLSSAGTAPLGAAATVSMFTLGFSCTALWDDVATNANLLIRNGIGGAYPAAAVITVPVGIHHLPSTIQAGGSAISSLIQCRGMLHLVVGVNSSQNGNLSMQRYIDTGGLIANGAANTAALTGGTAALVEVTDGKAVNSIQITITNTGAATATLTGLTILMLSK